MKPTRYHPPFYFYADFAESLDSNLKEYHVPTEILFRTSDAVYTLILQDFMRSRENIQYQLHPPANGIAYEILHWKSNPTDYAQRCIYLGGDTDVGKAWIKFLTNEEHYKFIRDQYYPDTFHQRFIQTDFAKSLAKCGKVLFSAMHEYSLLIKLLCVVMRGNIDAFKLFCEKLDRRLVKYPFAATTQLPSDTTMCCFIVEDSATPDDVIEMLLPQYEYGIDGKTKVSF